MRFVDAFDMSYLMKFYIEYLAQRSFPITKLTESLSLFDMLRKATITFEKPLKLDLQCVKMLIKNEVQELSS